MAKLTLTDLANLQNEQTAVSAVNANNARIEAAVENTLSRDGTSPNFMNSILDMNSHKIVNLVRATSASEPVTYGQFISALDGEGAQDIDDLIDAIPYTPERFGAVGNGIEDDTDAIIDAANGSPGGGFQGRPGAIYRFVGPRTLPNNFNFNLNGATLKIEQPVENGTTSPMNKGSIVGSPYTTSDMARQRLDFNTTTPVDWVAGDYIFVSTDNADFDGSPTQDGRYPFQLRRIFSVADNGSGGSVVNVDTAYDFTPPANAIVRKLSFWGTLSLTNGKIDFSGVHPNANGLLNIQSYSEVNLRNLELIPGSDYNQTSLHIFQCSYGLRFYLENVRIDRYLSKGGVLLMNRYSTASASRLYFSGDSFGCAAVNCDRVAYKSVYGGGHAPYGGHSSIRGLRNIGCLHNYFSDIVMINYDSAIKSEDCGNVICQGYFARNCMSAWNISHKKDNVRWSNHVLCNAIFEYCGHNDTVTPLTADVIGDVYTNPENKIYSNIIIKDSKRHVMNLAGKGLLLNNILIDGWPSGFNPIVISTLNTVIPTGSMSNIRCINGLGSGINIPTAAVDFHIDSETVYCNTGAVNGFDSRPGYSEPIKVFVDTGNTTPSGAAVLIVKKNTSEVTTVTLSSTPKTGQRHTIKDGKGDAASYPITINASHNIEIASTSYTISQNYGWVSLRFDGTKWNIVGVSSSDTSLTPVSLTDAATIATNCALNTSGQFYVTLTDNRTMGAPTNTVAGRQLVYRVTQDLSGSRTLTWNSVFKFPGATAPTLSTATGATDRIVFHIHNSTNIEFVAIAKGIA